MNGTGCSKSQCRAPVAALVLLLALAGAARSQVVEFEYYWNDEPGGRHGPVANLLSHRCPLEPGAPRVHDVSELEEDFVLEYDDGTPLASGQHRLHLRVRSDLGWSPWASHWVYVPPPTDLRITGGEWFLDEPPTDGKGTTLDIATCEAISRQGGEVPWMELHLGEPRPPPGPHRLGFRLFDSEGTRTAIHWANLHIPDPGPATAVFVTALGPVEKSSCSVSTCCPGPPVEDVTLMPEAENPQTFWADVDLMHFGVDSLVAVPLWVRAEGAGGATLEPLIAPPMPAVFVRGDANADGDINITDGLFTLQFLFLGGNGPLCDDAADANDDESINVSDPIAVLNYLFAGGSSLPSPVPLPGAADYSPRESCGSDPEDCLRCIAFPPCALLGP